MTTAKKPAAKKPRKSRAKGDNKPTAADADPQEEGAPTPSNLAPTPEPHQGPISQRFAKVARNADQHTRDAKRQKAIVEVVLSWAGGMLQDMPDDGGELQQIGVRWASGTGHYKMVPYNEIVAAFVAQAPYLAESIKVTDER